ncbi:ParA family protein [Niveispirillum sp. KHB5.9]|uniref:ParA family protein n=1 Tax=Niveispirillum sp. KHB5.9 TaxID=3400269 RepID=UPI003A8A9D97
MPIRNRRATKPVNPLTKLDTSIKEAIKAHGPTAICFFNNKGGVGKTTLVANLAAELALNFGMKVLVIDADPQCNLTQYVLEEEESFDIYSEVNGDFGSIYSIIRPLALGKGYESVLPVRGSKNFGFDVIIGDPRLALQEDLLANDWRDAKGGGMRGIRTTYVFADVVNKAKDMGYDFVFFDMGPSLGAINRSILLAVDCFVVPMSIDIFSRWAVRNIGTTVAHWQKELRTGITLAEDPSELPDSGKLSSLRFLGYVTQQHKERAKLEEDITFIETEENGKTEIEVEFSSVKKKRIVQAYEDINAQFPAEIADSLKSFYKKTKINPHLGNIRHLGSLAPMSQSQHTPMISIRGKGSYTQLRKQARDIYREIARRFGQNLIAD